MTALLVVPIIDWPYSQPLIDSLHPSLHERLFIVDNAAEPGPTQPDGVTVDRPGRNQGVARSWSRGVREAQRRDCTAVILLSGNVRFGASAGRDLYDLALDDGPGFHAPAPCHWHTAIVRLSTVERVGMFDENFFPAYWEEIDYLRRMALADVSISFDGSVDATQGRDGHGVDRLRSNHGGYHTINYDALKEYWHQKWEVDQNLCMDLTQGHLTPFGLPVGLDYWEPATIDDLLVRYNIVGT